jgi:hypothetical protein
MLAPGAYAQMAMEAYSRQPTFTGHDGNENIHVVAEDVAGILRLKFRGSKDPKDFALDLMALPMIAHEDPQHDVLAGPMHAGVLRGVYSVLDDLLSTVTGRDYELVGHSLGGGLALGAGAILTSRGHPPKAIVTFAALRVGYDRYQHVLADVPIIEFKNGNDPIPQLPPTFMHARPPTDIGKPSIVPITCHFMSHYLAAVMAMPAAA